MPENTEKGKYCSELAPHPIRTQVGIMKVSALCDCAGDKTSTKTLRVELRHMKVSALSDWALSDWVSALFDGADDKTSTKTPRIERRFGALDA